jgi:hypothetical protein
MLIKQQRFCIRLFHFSHRYRSWEFIIIRGGFFGGPPAEFYKKKKTHPPTLLEFHFTADSQFIIICTQLSKDILKEFQSYAVKKTIEMISCGRLFCCIQKLFTM